MQNKCCQYLIQCLVCVIMYSTTVVDRIPDTTFHKGYKVSPIFHLQIIWEIKREILDNSAKKSKCLRDDVDIRSLYLVHRIQQPIPKLRIWLFTIFLTNQKKTFKTLVCLGIFFVKVKSDRWEILGFVVSELVVGFGEQDTSVSFFWGKEKGQWFTFTIQFKHICNKMSETHSKYSKGCIWLCTNCTYVHIFCSSNIMENKDYFWKNKGKNNWNFVDFYRRHKKNTIDYQTWR